MNTCEKYVIVGQTNDGEEHLINAFFNGESYIRMLAISWIYKFKKPLKRRYVKIYLKNLYDIDM